MNTHELLHGQMSSVEAGQRSGILRKDSRSFELSPEHCLVHYRVHRVYVREVKVKQMSLNFYRRHLDAEAFFWNKLILCGGPYPGHGYCPRSARCQGQAFFDILF